MGGPADPAASVRRGRRPYEQRKPDPAGDDLHDAWRLAFVVVADEELATRAVTTSFLAASPGDRGDPADISDPGDTSHTNNTAPTPVPRLDLLAATLRISLTRAAESPHRESESAVTTALWQLPPDQRAALWLTTVENLDNVALGSLLGLTPANASHVAGRATEWLDVALDQESGPLCPREADLDDYVRDQLPDDEADEMEAHIPGCVTCRTKARAYEELGDLKSVLMSAVPKPPAELTLRMLDSEDRPKRSSTAPTLQEPAPRTPAVRPLVACCVALLIMGLIGLKVVGTGRTSSDPPLSSNDPSRIVPGPSNTSGGATAANQAPPTATTVTVTTTSLPAVTFPTIPPAAHRTTRR